MRTCLLLLLCAACSTTKGQTRKSDATAKQKRARAERAKRRQESDIAVERETDTFTDSRPKPRPTAAERKEFDRIWEHYRRGDPRWPRERDRFGRRSDAAGYLLAGHLLRHYMRANAQRDRAATELVRAKNEIVEVGAPCAPALVDMMVMDRIPTPSGKPFIVDDLTRQDCSDMLERMGPRGVGDLLSTLARKDLGIKGRRHVLLTLGGTGDKRVLEPLVTHLSTHSSWQVRADAAIALGKLGDRRALQPLHEAVLRDKDRFVVKQAGKARLSILRGR